MKYLLVICSPACQWWVGRSFETKERGWSCRGEQLEHNSIQMPAGTKDLCGILSSQLINVCSPPNSVKMWLSSDIQICWIATCCTEIQKQLTLVPELTCSSAETELKVWLQTGTRIEVKLSIPGKWVAQTLVGCSCCRFQLPQTHLPHSCKGAGVIHFYGMSL